MIKLFDKNKNTDSLKNKGFTLVELIVVLIILAILAAVLVPMLLGHIDRAKEKQDLLNAKNCLTAAQAELTKLYASSSQDVRNGSVVPEAPITNTNGDVNADPYTGYKGTRVGTDFSRRVLAIADDDPYCLIIGTEFIKNSGYDFNKMTPAEKPAKVTHGNYTVYYALYMKDEDSDPLYFDGTSWSRNNPRNTGKMTKPNEIDINGRKVKIQFYIITSANGRVPDKNFSDLAGDKDRKKKAKDSSNIWTWLRFYVGAEDYQ